MKGFCYIENRKPVVNERKKPEAQDYEIDGCENACEYYMVIWNDSCMEVENVKKIKYRTHTVWYYTHDKGMTEILHGEQCEYKKIKSKITIIN